MGKIVKDYYQGFFYAINAVKVTDRNGHIVDFDKGIEMSVNLIMKQHRIGNKIMFIGNGGSAAISSHMSTDFCKNAGMKAFAFNDPFLLTCLSNDFGYEYVFRKPIEMFAEKGDILFAISSSGKSKNILLGVSSARLKDCKIITLSGFKDNNPLRSSGDINFYVPSESYGYVEIIHHSICHCILDIIKEKKGLNG